MGFAEFQDTDRGLINLRGLSNMLTAKQTRTDERSATIYDNKDVYGNEGTVRPNWSET